MVEEGRERLVDEPAVGWLVLQLVTEHAAGVVFVEVALVDGELRGDFCDRVFNDDRIVVEVEGQVERTVALRNRDTRSKGARGFRIEQQAALVGHFDAAAGHRIGTRGVNADRRRIATFADTDVEDILVTSVEIGLIPRGTSGRGKRLEGRRRNRAGVCNRREAGDTPEEVLTQVRRAKRGAVAHL